MEGTKMTFKKAYKPEKISVHPKHRCTPQTKPGWDPDRYRDSSYARTGRETCIIIYQLMRELNIHVNAIIRADVK